MYRYLDNEKSTPIERKYIRSKAGAWQLHAARPHTVLYSCCMQDQGTRRLCPGRMGTCDDCFSCCPAELGGCASTSLPYTRLHDQSNLRQHRHARYDRRFAARGLEKQHQRSRVSYPGIRAVRDLLSAGTTIKLDSCQAEGRRPKISCKLDCLKNCILLRIQE